jgi:hypothetical protein
LLCNAVVVLDIGRISLNAKRACPYQCNRFLDRLLSAAGDNDLRPSAAKVIAADSPIPLFPPVITAILPESVPIMLFLPSKDWPVPHRNREADVVLKPGCAAADGQKSIVRR